MVSRYLFTGRRRGGRRAAEACDAYVDRFTAVEWAMVLALLCMSLVDWGWTVAHLQRGTPEANPALAWALEWGGLAAFSAFKLGVTLLVATFLLVHVRYRWTRKLLPVALVCYVGVLGIHVMTELTIRAA